MLREQVHYWFVKRLNLIYITSNTKNHCFGSNEYRRIAILRKYLNRLVEGTIEKWQCRVEMWSGKEI